jgi:hypothetical protein
MLLLLEMGISLTFCPNWPQTAILPISASQVAGITIMSHYAQLSECFLILLMPRSMEPGPAGGRAGHKYLLTGLGQL